MPVLFTLMSLLYKQRCLQKTAAQKNPVSDGTQHRAWKHLILAACVGRGLEAGRGALSLMPLVIFSHASNCFAAKAVFCVTSELPAED